MKEIEKWQQRCKKNDNDKDSGDLLEMTTGSGISDSIDKMRAKETENDYDSRIWGANGGGMSPPYGGGVFYR